MVVDVEGDFSGMLYFKNRGRNDADFRDELAWA